MTEAAERKALRAVRKAQADFEKADTRREKTRVSRRTVFEEAQAAGLSMHAFARGGRPEVRAATKRPDSKWGRCYPPHDYEALLLTPGLTGLRLGEFLALRRADFDGAQIAIRSSAHEGELIESSDQKNHERTVPVPPSLADLLEALPARDDTDLLFPTPTGKLWRERNFYRSVWVPRSERRALTPTPHEFRHSYVTHLRAAGIDDADLARVAGHTVDTMISVYTHALERSHEAIRGVIG